MTIEREIAKLLAKLDALEANRQAIAAKAQLTRFLIERGVDPERAEKAGARTRDFRQVFGAWL